MAWIPLGGKTRRFRNTETGEEISRRQYQNRIKGISFEAKAKASKAANIQEALARPAKGRKKVSSASPEAEARLKTFEEQQAQKLEKELNRRARAKSKKVHVPQIRPQLLKTGHRAARVPFNTHAEYVRLLKQAREIMVPLNGRRLITAYGLGVVGYDERTGKELDATLVTMQSPSIVYTEDELENILEDFLMEKIYFIFSHWFMHLHFNQEYAEHRLKESRRKNIPKIHRKPRKK